MGKKAAKDKTKAELKAELEMLKRHCIGDNVTKIITTGTKYGVFLGTAYFGYRSIEELAGKTTEATIDVNGSAGVDVKLPDGVMAWPLLTGMLGVIIGAAGLLYGRYQRKLKQDVIERLQGRIKKLETGIDENRSSSCLTSRGETNPEDI